MRQEAQTLSLSLSRSVSLSVRVVSESVSQCAASWADVGLCLIVQQAVFTPVKLFSVDRVYRNEKMDATHLAEFHQVEGLVADYDLTLGNLMGILRQFFCKLGITDIRFKPAFNPYTEPSMEVFGFHPVLKRVCQSVSQSVSQQIVNVFAIQH
jgi:O-phosphoseryl-tRNA(Cys) synthetase